MDFQSILETLLNYSRYIITGFGIGIGLYYAKYAMPFIMWLKGGVENQDKSLENKDLQIAFISFIACVVVIAYLFGVVYPPHYIYSIFGTLAGLYGIKEIYNHKNGKD